MTQPTPAEITGAAMSKYPVCPHCGEDPAKLAAVLTKIGGSMMIVVFCENASCRKIHGVSPLPMMPPAPELPTPKLRGPGLWLP